MHPPSFDQAVTFLYTKDLERAGAFYGTTLGLEPVLDQGMCRIFRIAGQAFLGICHDPERALARDGVILTLVTDAVDQWHGHLAGLGVEFERAPTYNHQFDIYHTFLRDPDGHLVEIQQFRDARWPRPDQ